MAGKATVSIILDQGFMEAKLTPGSTRNQTKNLALGLQVFNAYASSSPENLSSTALSGQVYRLVQWAIQAGQPVFYEPNEIAESPEQFYYNESGRALLVPIVNDERTIGVIHVVAPDRPHRFNEGDMVVLRTIANTASIMLDHIQPAHE